VTVGSHNASHSIHISTAFVHLLVSYYPVEAVLSHSDVFFGGMLNSMSLQTAQDTSVTIRIQWSEPHNKQFNMKYSFLQDKTCGKDYLYKVFPYFIQTKYFQTIFLLFSNIKYSTLLRQ
jgi:hypothetical protein